MTMKSAISLFTFFMIFPFVLQAQITKPSLSPRTVVEQQIGLASVKLDYGRPNKQGRKIFGALIPYGKVWRTGANASTKITFDREVLLADNAVPAGTYGLYSIPTATEWTIILHKNSELWGAGGYQEENDFLRFTVPTITLTDTLETLAIQMENFHANGGDLVIAWENTKVTIPVFVDSDAAIFAEIEDKILKADGDIKAPTYFDAAQFYYFKEKDLALAQEWFDKAIALRPNAFWYVYYRAELAYHLKEYGVAKKYATQSLEMARKSTSSDFGYIAKNELLLQQIATAN